MDRFTARRKLLRGSLSAPLVLTVASPAALARQSFEACLFRAGQDPAEGVPPFIDDSEHDVWLRSNVEIYSGKLRGESQERLFYRSSLNRYYPVDVCGQSDGYTTGDFEPDSKPKSEGIKQALVYVDSDGNRVGFGACRPQDAFPVSGSCWASFDAGKRKA